MSRKWTEAQSAAMNIRGKTLLVSAAAGSGKTATLTERIIRRITDAFDPADISRMLVVTFTRTAAAELRTRIFSALSEALAKEPSNKHLASQLMKVGSAHISTIDSFYFDILKANLAELGLSSSVRIADDAEYALMSYRIMESTIDRFYEEEPDFPAFAECFASTRQLKTLPDIFLGIHNKLSSIPEGIEFLSDRATATMNEAENDFFATSYGKVLQQSTALFIDHYLSIFSDAVEFISADMAVNNSYGDSFRNDLELLQALYTAVQSSSEGYSRIQKILNEYSPLALRKLSSDYSSDTLELYKAKRTELQKKLKNLRERSFSKSHSTIAVAMCDTAKHIYMLYRLLSAFEESADAEKKRLGILTFTDIRRYTLSLLVAPDGTPTDTARRYAEQFSDIYIDEYQDVDRVQDLIFSSISKPDNRFMVGDIKQSIYQFRGSEPTLFASYRESFPLYSTPEGEKAQSVSVFMSDNFRCDESIIEFSNLVCSRILKTAKSVGYTEEDDLKFSKICPDGHISSKVSISIISSPSKAKKLKEENADTEDMASNKELEAEYIAEEIDRLIHNEKKADGSPIRPCDIAVLFRSKKIGPLIAEALKKKGILSSEADAQKYFENPDVLTVLCLLNTIDNPQRDTYLAGTLNSPLFNFSMEELITIRLGYDASFSLYAALCKYAEEAQNALAEKCRDFIITLEAWQADAASLAVDRFLRILFDSERFISCGLVSYAKNDGEGGNILLLYEYARKFESGSFKGLYQFIEYINSMIEKDKTFNIGETSVSKDRVSLMTIHKSKGLEFPVCFVCDTMHSIRSKDADASFVYDYPTGVALKISEASGFARINTPMREAIISKLASKQAEEDMRILYVALTRARERLYITAATSKDPAKLISNAHTNNIFFDRYSAVSSCSSYMDWILASCSDNSSKHYELQIKNIETTQKVEEDTEMTHASYFPNKELMTVLRDKFSFKYPYSELRRVPSKISVSRLYPDVLDENDESLELFTEEKKATVPDFFLGNDTAKASAAERGTATHLFMQFCDFKYANSHGAAEELVRLTHKKFLPPNAASLIYTDELERFLSSELMKKILSAKSVIREQRFNVELSAKGFTKDEKLLQMMENETLAVQGVIDLVLICENGEIELYDYKTDRLSREELANYGLALERINQKHGQQLFYYSRAIELLMGKKCHRVAVYSTHSAQLYDIDTDAFSDFSAAVI